VLASAASAGVGLGAFGALFGWDGPRIAPPAGARGTAAPGTTGDAGRPGDGASTDSADSDERPARRSGSSVVGANLNGRPRRLLDGHELIDASDTRWVRAFLDVREKQASATPPADDPDVLALRQVARERACHLVVSLKWDFAARWGDKPPMAVPRPDSAAERDLFRTATECLEAIGADLDVVVLGNEPMWETRAGDIRVDDPPIVGFTRNAKDHLVRHGDHGDPTYLVGAFNRNDSDRMRERVYPQFYEGMYDFVREDGDVDGVDLHLHFVGLADAEGMIAAAREALPDGVITATEFSPMWRYVRHVAEPIGTSESGARFARDHDLPPTTTAVDYFEAAKRDPRSPEEVAAFYEAMPWYNTSHVADVCALFDDYGVSVGTLGFLAGLGMRNEDWTDDWAPFHINMLFQPVLMRADRGIEHTALPPYVEDYRARTG